MTYRELFDQMALAEQLKCNLRHSWTSSGRQESVAEHSWRLALLSWFAAEAYPGIDAHKAAIWTQKSMDVRFLCAAWYKSDMARR